MKAVVDTNIIIDALTGRDPFREAAEAIFSHAAAMSFEAYLIATSITDIHYLLRKHLHDRELTHEAIGKLLVLFQIQDVTYEDCINALASEMKDFEDAVLSSCAGRAGADYIITRNIKDFKNSFVPAILPDDFLKLLSDEEPM